MPAQLGTFLNTYLVPLGWKLLGAAVVLVLGLAAIRVVRTASRRVMQGRSLDPTLSTYLDASIGILLKVLLVVAIFGVLGVETTSFAALLAAAGIAIGAAWSGLLANFAAGLFLLFLRPFKVGDLIDAGGVSGVVREVGLFATSLDTPDNVRVTVGNNKVFSDSIRNYSANPHRRVDLTCPIAYGTDPLQAISRLNTELASIPHVLTQPASTVEILSFAPTGVVVAVRSYCHNEHYWQVYFDTSRVIRQVVGDAGYAPVPTAVLTQAQGWSEHAH